MSGNPRADPTRRVILLLFGVPAFFALFMFVPAGTLAWARGWLFITLFLVLETLVVTYVWRTNPELLDSICQCKPRTYDSSLFALSGICRFTPSLPPIPAAPRSLRIRVSGLKLAPRSVMPWTLAGTEPGRPAKPARPLDAGGDFVRMPNGLGLSRVQGRAK